MEKKNRKKLVLVREYVAEVEIQLIESETGWTPTFSMEDAEKLDKVRQFLLDGDLANASKISKVYSLTPVAV